MSASCEQCNARVRLGLLQRATRALTPCNYQVLVDEFSALRAAQFRGRPYDAERQLELARLLTDLGLLWRVYCAPPTVKP